MARPIWQDWIVDIFNGMGVNDPIDYSVKRGSTTIYTGRAWPTEDGVCYVRLNDIIAPYLRAALPSYASVISAANCGTPVATFSVYVGSTEIETDSVYMDYSYDYAFDPYTYGVASDPIRREIHPRMPLLFSVFQQMVIQYGWDDATAAFSLAFSNGFNIGNDGQGSITVPAGQCLYIPANLIPGNGSITIDGNAYRVVNCADPGMALYYINAYGGWDAFLPRSVVKRTDDYTRATFKAQYDNGESRNRGETEYRNEVARRFEIHTGLLTDDEASRMHHLIGSPLVYLYDFRDPDNLLWYPVVITDTDCEFKSFRNQGGKRVEYTLGVKVAHDMHRR